MDRADLKAALEAFEIPLHIEEPQIKVLLSGGTVPIEDVEYWPGSNTIILKPRND